MFNDTYVLWIPTQSGSEKPYVSYSTLCVTEINI